MNLTMRHIEVFHAVMQAGSVSRAAKALNLTQPAVSIALAKAEQEVGFPLFHRSKGHFAPTREAQLLHGEAEQTLLAIERVQARAEEIRDGELGAITVATNGVCAINLLPWVIAEFQRDHPQVRIDLKVRTSRAIASLIEGRLVDIGLIDAPVPIPGLSEQIIRRPCVCIVREDDALAALPVITPESLDGRSVIAITRDHPVDRELDQICVERGVRIERRVSGSYFAIARNLVRVGAGVALVDAMNGTARLDDGVTWRPFKPEIQFELALLLSPQPALTRAVETFLEVLRENLFRRFSIEPAGRSEESPPAGRRRPT